MKKALLIFAALAFLSWPFVVFAATTIQVEGWGGGGGGRSAGASAKGGGGGAYARLNAFVITSGVGYAVVVGTGGAVNLNGASTTFNGISLLAAPGWGVAGVGAQPQGQGGGAATSTGDATFSGGNGGNLGASNQAGGSGGGAGGSTANGGVGGNGASTGCTAGSVGAGGATGGGNGGKGGDNASVGAQGSVPGGGGGGAEGGAGTCTGRVGGAGAAGQLVITVPLGRITSATGGTHTTDATNDIWTFTASGTWTPTFTAAANPFQLWPLSLF